MKNSALMERRVSHLAVAGLMLAILSSICGPCIAAVHHSSTPGQDTSPCHSGNDEPQPRADSCDCPAWMGTGVSLIDAAVASERAASADEQPLHPVFPSPARRIVLAGSFPPDYGADIPRVSPIRSFCIQLE